MDWLTCNDPLKMLALLDGEDGRGNSVMERRCSDRKLRLWAVACCRRFWRELDAGARAAVVVAERFADGKAHPLELDEADRNTDAMMQNSITRLVAWTCANPGYSRQYPLVSKHAEELGLWQCDQAQLLREVMGNGLSEIGECLPGAAVSRDARAVAQVIYDERKFEELPILADALEDGGCTDAAILNHLRQPGGHVLGCWALDAALGRK